MGVGFYASILEKLLKQGLLFKEMSVLVVAGGDRDRAVFQATGFTNVTISNLDSRLTGSEFAPYAWSFQDAENLTYSDCEFSLVVVHAGLHHCRSPHRALLETYRVARRAALIFEARDNLFLKAATFLGISENYEISAVKAHNYEFGGVRNTAIPNYIYRWTEYEIRKTLQSYAPQTKHRFLFFYGTRVPHNLLNHARKAVRLGVGSLMGVLFAVTRVFPKLGNEFGIFILKPAPLEHLQPWLMVEDSQTVMRR